MTPWHTYLGLAAVLATVFALLAGYGRFVIPVLQRTALRRFPGLTLLTVWIAGFTLVVYGASFINVHDVIAGILCLTGALGAAQTTFAYGRTRGGYFHFPAELGIRGRLIALLVFGLALGTYYLTGGFEFAIVAIPLAVVAITGRLSTHERAKLGGIVEQAPILAESAQREQDRAGSTPHGSTNQREK